ncbi:MAG: substrate-binding domain-containing protein [Cyanobacteria bacterium P01_F01_bin.13]
MPAASTQLADGNIKIGGSAETYEVLQRLADAYQAKNEGTNFTFSSPSQTSGGLQAVRSNVIDIGGVSRALTSAELRDRTYVPLVKTPLLMVVHESVADISDITSDQLRAIYSGQITNWQALGGPDADIVLFDFAEDENEKQILRQTYLGNDLAVAPTAIVFTDDDKLLDTAAITEFSIAAVPYEDSLDALPLNVLSISGVFPSAQNIQSGSYVMALPLGMVVDQQPSAALQSFLEFVVGPDGQQVLADTGYVPINID